MVIEKKKVEDLKAADYNPRKDLKPGDAEYEKLKAEYEAAVRERDEKKAAEKAAEEIGDSTEGGN